MITGEKFNPFLRYGQKGRTAMKNTNRNKITKLMAICTSLIMSMGMLTSCGAEDKSDSYRSNGNNGINNTQQNITGNNKYENKGDMTETDGIENNTAMEEQMPDDYINTEEYNKIIENEFLSVAEHPLSTFSTDVDTASFTNIRRMIDNRENINPDAVRTEEFINYLKYSYPQPDGDDKISITTEFSDCPWNDDSKLMLVGLQAKDIETKDIDSNIVFLIDVSGSMNSYDKLPLVQEAFRMLAENLSENDRISIVTYAGSDQVVLKGESGANQSEICNALDSLEAGGSTAGAAGINTAYEIAQEYFIEGGNNRVILATDGDLNVGLSSEEELTELIEEKRDNGVFLSVLGFGTGNYKDNRLEALADNGNGNYAYIDSVDEAERVLVTEFSGTMFTVAKDTKVQVEFNPNNVSYYKLVGYENRLLNDEDFEDDTKDAGDVGSGQQVTALYEIILNGNANTSGSGKTLKYQTDVSYPTKEAPENTDDLDGELLTVSIRYKEADEDNSKLIDKAVTMNSYVPFEENSNGITNLAYASTAAEFAMYLRGSSALPDDFNVISLLDRFEKFGIDYNELSNVINDYVNYYL